MTQPAGSPVSQCRSPRRQLITLWLPVVMSLMLLLPTVQMASAQTQEAEPTADPALQNTDPLAPQPTTAPASATAVPTAITSPTPTPAGDSRQAPSTTSTTTTNPATEPGSPAILAHGAAYISGDDVSWEVRRLNPPTPTAARATTGPEAIIYQREGTTIIRNNATGKRALLVPGSAYFRSADDGFVVMSDGNPATAWQFELSEPGNPAVDAFYAGPALTNLNEGVYSMTLVRYVLQPNETAQFTAPQRAGIIMVDQGNVEVTIGGNRSLLATTPDSNDGLSVTEDGSMTNTTSQPTVVLYAYLGDELGDDSAGTAQGSANTTTSETTSSDGTSGTTETTSTLQESANTTTDTQQAPPPDATGVTSINVTAAIDLYVVITVDGTVVFDGPLPAGGSSGAVIGAEFEVYTSSGANTTFTNACGDTFHMGYEEGEATYQLHYDPATSCAPNQ